jgi:hypothetical protein
VTILSDDWTKQIVSSKLQDSCCSETIPSVITTMCSSLLGGETYMYLKKFIDDPFVNDEGLCGRR